MLAPRRRFFQAICSTNRKSSLSIYSRNICSSLKEEEKLFDKILIANRGEIAVRVIKTCRKLGIKTVAVYSEPDVNSVAVKMADEAICVGPAPSNQSYLKIDKILQAVKETGAQAVHPGYGFLSENQHFCQALEEAGIAFIGPGHEAIRAMGDKIESKLLAKEAGVNTIPGFLGIIENANEAIKVAREIGYPVMIKASAGGGGKGMRVAYDDEQVRMGFRLSKEEAASSFGDDRMFIEKFIEDPRHIEIQLIADQHGNVVPFPERECSIQRRNQKVIEEAPSVLLDEKTRQEMGKQAVMLAKKVGYVSAGTVEFLCDQKRNFYFLEMNTRLQVEHPVTELISQVDLVEQMIRIAAGHKLPEKMIKKPIQIHGWAFESRIYAEDPLRGFLPSIGRLLHYQEPLHLPGIRIDSGVKEGSEISMFYDPLIAKLISFGKNRQEALARMQEALEHYVIRGPGNNICFLQDVYRSLRFQNGNITTKFIEEEYPKGFLGVELKTFEKNQMIILGALMHLQRYASSLPTRIQKCPQYENENMIINDEEELTQKKTQRNKKMVPRFKVYQDVNDVDDDNNGNGKKFLIDVAKKNHLEQIGIKLYVSTDGPFGETEEIIIVEVEMEEKKKRHKRYETNIYTLAFVQNQWHIIGNIDWQLNGPLFVSTFFFSENNENKQPQKQQQQVATQVLKVLPEGFRIQHFGAVHDVIIRSEKEKKYSSFMKPKPKMDFSKFLLCPMPGVLISIAVKEGDQVQLGQELAVIEAMKMQNVLRAEKKGIIKKINHQPGDSLKVDELILEYE